MNDATRHALDRIEAALDRSGRRRRRLSTAPIVLAFALILAYQLLVRLVPRLWAEILPGGFAQGGMLSGPSRLVWSLAWFCERNFAIVLFGVVGAVGFGLVLGRSPTARPFVWLLAVAAIGLDAVILVIALKTGIDASGVGQMLG